MSVEERLLKPEEFAADVRNFTKALTDIIQRYDERMDEQDARLDGHAGQMAELREAHAETERAIAALADAQIRTEDALKKIIEKLDGGKG